MWGIVYMKKVSVPVRSKKKRKESEKRVAGEKFYRCIMYNLVGVGKNVVQIDSCLGNRYIHNFDRGG